jgi:hypothetical protein
MTGQMFTSQTIGLVRIAQCRAHARNSVRLEDVIIRKMGAINHARRVPLQTSPDPFVKYLNRIRGSGMGLVLGQTSGYPFV